MQSLVNHTLTKTRQAAGMLDQDSPLDPDQWVRDVFSAKAVLRGEVIRRKARDIERYAGWDRFLAEIARRGFRAVRNGGQVVVFCNREPVVPISYDEIGSKSYKDFNTQTGPHQS